MSAVEPERATRVERLAREALDLLGTGRQVAPFSARHPDFALAEAYDVVARVCALRRARGETPVGRKIGFTNRAVWTGYGISAPIWNHVYDSTVHDLATAGGVIALDGFAEPRIEPEIVLHLARAPTPEMDTEDLLGCIDWIAEGFELVHSIFPGWAFTAADAAAAHGVHGALLLGDRRAIGGDRMLWGRALTGFTVELVRDDGVSVRGHARNVLGGPVEALRFLVQELARHPASLPLAAGELVTTGTLTEAMPAVPGEAWTVRFDGIDLGGARIAFRSVETALRGG